MTVTTESTQQREQTGRELNAWFHLLAGPVLYSLYFLAGYFWAEWACKMELLQFTFLGLQGVSLSIIALTAVFFAVSLYEIYLSFRQWRSGSHEPDDNQMERTEEFEGFVGFSGFLLGTLFGLAILLTGLTMFFLRPPCEWT